MCLHLFLRLIYLRIGLKYRLGLAVLSRVNQHDGPRPAVSVETGVLLLKALVFDDGPRLTPKNSAQAGAAAGRWSLQGQCGKGRHLLSNCLKAN